MKIKQCLLIFALLLTRITVFAMSPIIESFSIYNYSNKEVVINIEFWEGESEEIHNYMWTQDVCGRWLTIQDFLAVVNNNVLRPKNDDLSIIQYYPRDRADEIPFIDKMKAIFKKLEIVCDDGKRIITLDSLEEQVIKKMVLGGETAYILEIFDYDLEGKPASEW